MGGHNGVLRDEQAWLEWRRQGVGASDSPAILGVSPSRTRLQVFLEKVGRDKPTRPAECLDWGKRLEPLIAEAYEAKTGCVIEAREACVVSREYPWLRATLDGVCQDGRVVEFKALSVFNANNFRAACWQELPEAWLVQTQHQGIVCEVDWVDLAVFYPLEVRIFSIPRLDKVRDAILRETEEFWGCVQDDVPPRTLDPRDAERISLAFPKAEGDVILDDPALLGHVSAYLSTKDKAAKVALLDAMGDAETATLADGRRLRRKAVHRPEHTVRATTVITLTVEDRRYATESA